MLKSREFLREKSRGRVSGGSTSVCNVILRRYSLLEVPRRRIHNTIAKAMSICVAYGNKVMDTRLPQPAGCGDKYDVYGWCWERMFSAFCMFFKYPLPEAYALPSPSRGEGYRLHRPWCDKYDGLGRCRGRGVSAFSTFTIKAMSILAFLCLFATAAEAKICFLPVDGCDTKIITKVKDDNASSCQYDSQYKAEQGISACEIAYSPDKSQRKKKCWYRMCNIQNKNIFSTYEDCKNNLTDSQKCESCGSCYKRVAG